MADKPGDSAKAIAMAQIGKPYVMGGVGPDTFDCSGLMQYSYQQGPHIDITRSTGTQWNNRTTLMTFYDAVSKSGPGASQASGTPQLDPASLEVGDLLYYCQAGAESSQNNAHVKMFIGGGQTVEAPHTGDVVKTATLDLVGGGAEPFRGVKRTTGAGGGGSAGGGTGGGSGGSGGSGNQPPTSQDWQTMDSQIGPSIANYSDPPDNLPFSPLFQGLQIINGVTQTGGDMRFLYPGQAAPVMANNLVRGGMAEMAAKKYKCYFMMNPEQIAVSAGIDSSQLSPLQQAADFSQSGGYWVTNQTISFTIYFNRMYEVWQGNVTGPSDVGCRWDIRALERLVGIFDAQNYGSTTGTGNYGIGASPAMTIPLQVVFGGPNSMQFQGIIASLDYTFTRFSADMIPVEAYADVSVMRLYQPASSGADLVQSLINQSGQVGVQPGLQVSGPANGGALIRFGRPQ